jgi:hypothetical protein
MADKPIRASNDAEPEFAVIGPTLAISKRMKELQSIMKPATSY